MYRSTQFSFLMVYKENLDYLVKFCMCSRFIFKQLDYSPSISRVS